MADSGTRRDSTSTRKPHRPSAANGTSFELSLDDVSIIRQGWLTKQGKRIKTWKKRWFVLNRDFLIYYKTPKETKPQGVIKLSEITEISEMKSKKNKFIFKAVTAYRPFPICADSEQTRAAWMESLQEAVDALRTPDAAAEKPAESGSEAAPAEASTAADEKPGTDEATSSTAAAEAPAAAADDGDGSGSDDYYDSGTMVFKKPTKKPEPVDDDGDDGDDDNYDSGTMVFRPAEAAEADGSEEYDDGTMVRASGGDDDDYKPAFMRHIERKREEAAVRETNFDGLSEAELERMTAQITKQRDQEISVVTAKYETLRGVIMTVMAQKGVDSDG